MVEAASFQTIFQFLQTVSIMVGIAYYFIVMNNQRKNQKLTATYDMLEFYKDPKVYHQWLEVLRLEWDDVDDFFAKYNTTEWQSKWANMFQQFNGYGLMWKKGLIDIDEFAHMMPGCQLLWVRYKPVVERWRVINYSESFMEWEELSKALEPLVNDNWGTYVRDNYPIT